MARVAVIVSNPCTMDARVIKMARAARDGGHEVHVFATLGNDALPYEKVNKITFNRLEWRPSQIIIEHSPLRFLPKFMRGLSVFIAKKLTPFVKYRLFSGLFASHVAAVKPDIIHAHDLICLQAAIDAAEICGARVVYDAHELEVHRNPPLPFLQKRRVAQVEHKFGRMAFAVITVGRKVGEVLGAHLGRSDINILYNSPIIEPCSRDIRGELGLGPDKPLVIYVGKVTMGRGVAEILGLLPKLKGVTFATVGPVDEVNRNDLNKLATKLGVAHRFRILPPVPFEQVVDYISGADAGVISVEPVTLSYQYCMPNKLFEMSFADVPIISNKLDEIEEFLAENANGKIVDFEDQAALVYTIFRIFNEKDNYRFDAARRASLETAYSWQAQAAKLITIYDRALAAGRGSAK